MAGFAPRASRHPWELSGELPRIAFCSCVKRVSEQDAEPCFFEKKKHFRAPGDLLGHPLLVPGQALDTPGERLGHAPEPSPEEGGAARAETQAKVGF